MCWEPANEARWSYTRTQPKSFLQPCACTCLVGLARNKDKQASLPKNNLLMKFRSDYNDIGRFHIFK